MIFETTLWLTAESKDLKDEEKISISVEHTLTLEDLNEFVKEQDYHNYKEYFYDKIGLDDEDTIKESIIYIENGRVDWVTDTISFDCGDKKELENFISNKYQGKILREFLEKNINSSVDLDD